jgi:hypothetical protein
MKYFLQKNFLYHNIFIYIIILLIQTQKSLYIESGIKTFNKFLYYSRFQTFEEQNKFKTCSFNQGPNCYFNDINYSKNYYIENDSNNEKEINKQWIEICSKIPDNKVNIIQKNLQAMTSNYITKYSKEIDEEQNPKNEILNLLLTFDSFDVDTIKGDIYLEEKMGKIIYNEQIIADIKGKLLLKYDKDISEKKLRNLYKDYPSTTYGVIESENISISFGGRLFIVNYFYIKGHDEFSKYEPLNFFGYLDDKLIYGYTYTDNKKRNEKWLKVTFPELIVIDNLVVSGMYDIDNISFTFPNQINVDQNEVYSMYNYGTKSKIIEDDEI